MARASYHTGERSGARNSTRGITAGAGYTSPNEIRLPTATQNRSSFCWYSPLPSPLTTGVRMTNAVTLQATGRARRYPETPERVNGLSEYLLISSTIR